MKQYAILTAIILSLAVIAVAAPPMTYAVVGTKSFRVACTNGLNPNAFKDKIVANKGGVKSGTNTCRVSLNGSHFIIKADKPGDIAYLRARAAALKIDYTEYDHAGILDVVKGTNWTAPEE